MKLNQEEIDIIYNYRSKLRELESAVRARLELSDRILNYGPVPHEDYWKQAIDKANARLDKAYEKLRTKG